MEHPASGMNVLVTGANGFLGTLCVDSLFSVGATPIALVRPSTNAAELEGRGVEVRRASYDDAGALRAAVERIDAVIHCAGGGKVKSTKGFYDANTRTTQVLRDVLLERDQPLERFVHVSSIAAHGPAEGEVPADETSTPNPRSHYGKSKLAAERLLCERRDELPVTILRPPALYGPADTRMIPLFRMARRGLVPIVEPNGWTMLLFGQDCASACVAALAPERPSGEVFFVDDGTPRTRTDMLRVIGEAVGTSPVIVPIPLPVISAASRLAVAAGRLRDQAVVLTPDKVADLGGANWRFDSSRIRSELGWSPALDFETGARITNQDYEVRGWY